MPVFKQCKVCNKTFIQKTYKHCFCSRKCFYIDYNKNKKKKQYPDFVCPECKNKTRLTFYPFVSRVKWSNFKCPFCKKSNDSYDYEEIKSIKLSFKLEDFLDE